MANPICVRIPDIDAGKQAGGCSGACREFWIRIGGLTAASDQDAGGNDYLYTLLNPFREDMVILDALAVITTLDAQDGDIDVGLCDDAIGTTGTGHEVFDHMVNTGVGVLEGTVAQIITGGAKAIWRAPGTATLSYLYVIQAGDVDCAALRWNLFLKLIPYADLLSNVPVRTITVV